MVCFSIHPLNAIWVVSSYESLGIEHSCTGFCVNTKFSFLLCLGK